MRSLIKTVDVIDEQGDVRKLSIYQRLVRIPGCNPRPGMKEVFDEHGRHVNTTDEITFQVVATGELLTRV